MGNRIKGGMMAPTDGGSESKLRDDLEIPEEGIHNALCIGMVDLGTHSESFQGAPPKDKRKLMMVYEFPEIKQLVYEDDTEKRTYIKYDEISFSLYKSKLLKVVTALNNGKYTEDEMKEIDLFDFLGNRIILGIVHTNKTKDGKPVVYANIESYSRVGKSLPPEDFESDGNRYMFYIDEDGENFTTDNFAELPEFMKKKIKESKEGIAHKANGGTFAESTDTVQKRDHGSKNEDTDVVPEELLPKGYDFKDISGGGLSYSDYVNSGWTNKQLLSKGYLIKKEVAAVPPAPEEKKAAAPAAPKPDDFDAFADEDDDLDF